MTLVLGVDAGGSSIQALLMDSSNGRELWERTYPGRNLVFNYDTVDILVHVVEESGVRRCGVSLAGAGSRRAATRVRAELMQRCDVEAVVVGDFVAAHYACFGEAAGAVVIAGTGSACYARNDRGDRVLLGGRGPVLGDEGSAWWIGRTAVTAAVRALEGTGPATALAAYLDEHVTGGLRGLCSAAAELFVDRSRLAAVASMVDALGQSDQVAGQILVDAGDELAALASAALERLGPLPLGLVGGVFSSSLVTERLSHLSSDIVVGRRPVQAAAALADLEQAEAFSLGLD